MTPKKLALIPLKMRIREIESVYASAADRIVAAITSLEPDTYTAAKSGAVLSEVKSIIQMLDSAVQMWAPDAMRAAYDEAAGVARTRLEMIGAKPNKRYDPMRHEKKIAGLTKLILKDYFKANRTIDRTARKYLAVIQQAAKGVAEIEEIQAFEAKDALPFIKKVIKKARPESWAEANLSRNVVSKQIKDYLLKKLKGNAFINIRGRNYNIRDYSEMVARTRMREAQTEAVLDLSRQFENDLVQFSEHANPCTDCAQLEGQVFSISGNTPGYPMLTGEEQPPIHPCCEHHLDPTSENALRERNR